MVNADAPALTVKFGAFVVDPPVVPNSIDAVAAWLRVKPPVPVQVNPVAVPIVITNTTAVVLVNAMFPEPNEIARVEDPDELKVPVLSVNPASARVPSVSVVVLAISTVIASASVTVIPVPLTVVVPSVLPLLVTVAEARNVRLLIEVYVPPDASVRFPAMFKPPEVTVQVLPVNITSLK